MVHGAGVPAAIWRLGVEPTDQQAMELNRLHHHTVFLPKELRLNEAGRI